ncbi:helix-hairpin-helix domain-containing protein [Streptomyces sp. NPDC049916]|uniref:DNA polymerase Y family protein n=1 Tax=Streptomyces sp. NPDC049916 TaxID=3155156 RepID=UPI0034221C21
MTTHTRTSPTGRRDRAVLRARFDLTDHPDPDTVYEHLLDLVENLTPVFQPHPADHSVDLDISGALRLFGRDPEQIAALLQLRAVALHGVAVTIGGGRSPMLATMALDAAHPRQILVIAPDEASVRQFLRPQPVIALPGIGPALATRLARYGITTIADLADTPRTTLTRILGTATAHQLHDRARGTDHRPVQRAALVRSTSTTWTFAADELDPVMHRRALLGLADQLGTRLRTDHEICRALTLTVRYADRTHTTRSRHLPEPTAHNNDLARAAHNLHTELGLQRARVRTITLRADHLGPDTEAHHQLHLEPTDDRHRRLEAAADTARARFGDHVLTRGTLALPRR